MAASPSRIPVFLLSGFLGSGKTTLLNALLKHPDFANTAVVVNEFGEIGLDHYLIEQSRDNIVLLDAGCLCCTISDSLHETLAELHAKRVRGEVPPFERVVIETTGLADPGPILNTLLGHRLVVPHFRLDTTVVTLDAQHLLHELSTQAEVARQIAVADRLVLTKTDLVVPAQALLEAVRRINPLAPVVESVGGGAARAAFAGIGAQSLQLPARRSIFAAAATGDSPDREAGHHDRAHGGGHAHAGERDHGGDHVHAGGHSHAVHDTRIAAHCLIIEDPASWSGVSAWWRVLTARLGDRLLRCKGLIRIAETGELVFIQGVQRVFHRPERLADFPDADRRSRLVCITRDASLEEVTAALEALRLPPGSDPTAFGV